MQKCNFKIFPGIFALFFLFVVSCKNQENTKINQNSLIAEDIENLSKLDTIELTINSNDKMQFDKSELIVFENQTVVLTLVHTGTMPVTAMGHNFVLLEQGTSISGFAKEALKAKENEYIPVDEKGVIAYTDLIGGGESTTVIFEAPEKGDFDFICSFPGHYSIMKGKFIVK